MNGVSEPIRRPPTIAFIHEQKQMGREQMLESGQMNNKRMRGTGDGYDFQRHANHRHDPTV